MKDNKKGRGHIKERAANKAPPSGKALKNTPPVTSGNIRFKEGMVKAQKAIVNSGYTEPDIVVPSKVDPGSVILRNILATILLTLIVLVGSFVFLTGFVAAEEVGTTDAVAEEVLTPSKVEAVESSSSISAPPEETDSRIKASGFSYGENGSKTGFIKTKHHYIYFPIGKDDANRSDTLLLSSIKCIDGLNVYTVSDVRQCLIDSGVTEGTVSGRGLFQKLSDFF